MTYTKQIWTNGSSPLSASRFNHIEDGVEAAHTLVASVDAAKEDVGVAEAAAAAALATAQAYADTAVANVGPVTIVYPQRIWDPATSTWSARPAVPAGTVVTAYSWNYPAATPPTGAVDGDQWKPSPDSIYRP